MAAFRRQVEGVEEKLGGQITRVQQHGDRLREAALARVEAKLGNLEALQPKLDRKLAELSGNYKGLSDEMQAQIRRIDQMDSRLWEWRHQMEEEVRGKFTEVEQGHQQVASQVRLASATAEDAAKQMQNRFRRLEALVEARLGISEDVNQSLVALDSRLQELETSRIQELARAPFDSMPALPGFRSDAICATQAGAAGEEQLSVAGAASLSASVAQLALRMDGLTQEFQEMQARSEMQDERHRSLRTMLETRETEFRTSKFDRQDLERGVRELQAVVQELEKQRLEHSERIELYQRRFDHVGKSQEELGDALRRLQDRSFYAAGCGYMEPVPDPGLDSTAGTGTAEEPCEEGPPPWEECLTRLEEVESGLATVGEELERVRGDAEIVPRLASLIETLQKVGPKVMDHEGSIHELHERLGSIEARASFSPDAFKAVAPSADGGAARELSTEAIGRIDRLERDVATLKDAAGKEAENAIGCGPGL